MSIESEGESNLIVLGQLLLEDVCSDLIRFLHSHGDPARFSTIHIDREFPLGGSAGFADIRVEAPDEPPYFVQVQYASDRARVLRHIERKYGSGIDAAKLVIVVTSDDSELTRIEDDIRAVVPAATRVELWGRQRVQQLIHECFGVAVTSLAPSELVAVRARIDQGKEYRAFGEGEPASYAERVLRQNLLWHFSTWRLRQLRTRHAPENPDSLVPPGVYDEVVVMMADLSGFSRYVRDTPDDAVVRQALTSFYAKARYQVVNAGGMLDKFVGDEVVALFGLPERTPGYLDAAARTAVRLLDIGESVAYQWQRRIDLVQAHRGAHVAMSMGRVQLVTQRPLDNARLGVIGDCLNIAARLLPVAGPGEIVVSNVLYRAMRGLDFDFAERPPLDAKNLGPIQPWAMKPRAARS